TVAVVALERMFGAMIDKGIDRIEFQLQSDLAMLLVRAKAQVIMYDNDHSTPDSEQMSILCVTRDLDAFKKFMSHFKNSENSVAKKPMEDEKFKSLIKKYFDSDGNVLPSGKIKNPLMRTQMLSRNASPPTSKHGKEICRNTLVSSSTNSTNTASHSTLLSNTNSNNLSNSTDEDVIVVSSVRRRNSLNRKRAGPSSDHEPNTDFSTRFNGIRLKKKYKSSTDIVPYSKVPPKPVSGVSHSLGRRDPNSKLFYYHCVGYSSILITGSDYNRLIDMDELNDTLIVFYMRYALNKLREHDEAKARKYYLFDSYFYKKLSDLRDA
ncbi:289_t:CDS:2, partial [Dentiscutata erythropus]